MWRQLIHQNQDPDRIQERLKDYFDGIGKLLKYPERLASFAMYAAGLLGEGERKSVEPIAARAAGDDAKLCEKYHDRMCHLLHGSHWDDQAVRQYGVDRALAELTRLEPIESWMSMTQDFSSKATSRRACSGNTPEPRARLPTVKSPSV